MGCELNDANVRIYDPENRPDKLVIEAFFREVKKYPDAVEKITVKLSDWFSEDMAEDVVDVLLEVDDKETIELIHTALSSSAFRPTGVKNIESERNPQTNEIMPLMDFEDQEKLRRFKEKYNL